MHEVYDEDEVQPVEHRANTELTLGPMLLLSLFSGLLLLCGLCFGLGYSMGSHSAREASTAIQQPGDQTSSQATGSLAKPSAVTQNIPQQPQPAVADQPSDEASGAQTSDANPAANAAQPAVKPALPAVATTPAPASAPRAPALKAAPSGALVVQIATVSHQEDADVLVSALRKRGYAVTVRRDPADNQFHVRIGPFSKRNDADSMRQKLLHDGYNAIVQQ